jgi:putative SOS response-associated peptidase YedK
LTHHVAPNELMRPIPNRIPVILPPEDYAPWLDTKLEDRETLVHFLR